MALNATSVRRGSPDCVIPYEQQTCSKFVIVLNGEHHTGTISRISYRGDEKQRNSYFLFSNLI